MTAPTPNANLLASNRVRLTSAAVVFAAALALYLITVAPTVTLVDSGELIFAAESLGVAHPPGFPLYVLLAHAFTWLPFGSVAARVNLASAVFAAAAAAMLTLVVAEMLLSVNALPLRASQAQKQSQRVERKPKKQGAKDERRAAQPVSREWGLVGVVACVMAGLLFACSRTLWAYATITEVYTLNTLLITVIFFLMFRWRRRIFEDRMRSGKTVPGGDAASRHDRWLFAAALVFGLAMGVHHVSVAVTLPAFALLVFATEGFRFFISRRLVKAALCAFAGLAVYLYLPLAAMRSPLLNWGDPRSLERLWWHVTGRQYQVFFESSANLVGRQLHVFCSLVGREFGTIWLPLALLLAVAGLVAIFKRDRWLFGFLTLVVVFDMAWALNYEIAEDKDAYYLPTFLILTIAASLGLVWVAERLRALRLPTQVATALLLFLALAVPATAAISNFGFNNRRDYFIARDYVENTLKTIEPNGLLLTDDWQVYSPLLYLREVEGVRRDVVAIDIQQLRRTWYYDYLKAAYPEMMAAASDRVEAFLEDLRHWEQDPDLYQRDAMLNSRINTRFYDMLQAFVVNHLAHAPVYATINVATNAQSQNRELTEWLNKTYEYVPRGLVFQVVTNGASVEMPDLRLETRGLSDGSLKFADDDVVKVKVLPVYKVMMTNRGLYLAAHGRHDQAVLAFREALALDPGYKPAEQGLNDSLRALRTNQSAK